MTLISILFALAADRFWSPAQNLRRFDTYLRYTHWAWPVAGADAPGLALAVAPWVLAVAVLDHLLPGFLGFLFGLVILFLSLGPRDLDAQVRALLDAIDRDNRESVYLLASELIGRPAPEADTAMGRAASRAVLVAVHDRFLAVFFWFVVAGPTGAVLYRLVSLAGSNPHSAGFASRAATDFQAVLAWLPVRLAAASFALSGSFVDAVNRWRACEPASAGSLAEGNEQVLACAGAGALQLEREPDEPDFLEVREALALAWRAVIVWVVVTAVMTVAGWAA